MIEQNPFTSKTFTKIWATHFNNSRPLYSFGFIKKLKFFKHSFLPIYINTGKNLTKGISYNLNKNNSTNDFKNKTFLIFDVPQYFKTPGDNAEIKNLNLKKVKQYPGFAIKLDNYNDLASYLKATFSKSSNQKLRRYSRRLEHCFNISSKMLIGTIDKAEYDHVFSHFHELLTKRFDDKKTTNNNLNPSEWQFYREVAYPLILEKQAALHVIYNNQTPISVRLLYFSESIIFDAITVFDIDYTKFHIGKISIMKMLEWSFNSSYSIFDFSKGFFDYKESWSDTKYDFEYHIYYDRKSLVANILATTLSNFYKVKQVLREKEVNKKLHNLSFLLKNQKHNSTAQNIEEIDEGTINYNENMLVEIDFLKREYLFLRKPVFDFLFLSSEHLSNLRTYKINTLKKDYFLLQTPNKTCIIGTTD